MPQATLPFGEWRPDVALLDNEFASEVDNVLASSNSYKPHPSPVAVGLSKLSDGGNDSFTKVLLHCNGADASTTFTDDNASGGNIWTAAGNAQIDTADSKFGGASGLCDGTGDWILTPDSAAFTLGSSAFAFDIWVKPNINGSLLYIAGQADVGLAAATSAWVLRRNASNKIEFLVSNGSAFTTVTGTTSVTIAGGWVHIAASRTGNILSLAFNGAVEGTAAFTGSVQDSAASLRIGAGGEVTTTPWNGWWDEVRFSVGTDRGFGAAFSVPLVPYFTSGTCLGSFTARTTTGAWKVFAATRTQLFTWTVSGWTDISRAAGGAYNAVDRWTFAQFGDVLYACSGVNDVLQSIAVTAGTAFAAASGSPPNAATVHQLGEFLVLASLSTNIRKIRWSSINDASAWTLGTNLCDEQEMPDGGPVMGVAGDSIGFVLQDRAIRSMQYLPGDTTFIFTFSKIVPDKGAVSRFGYCCVGNVLYFVAEDGFYSLTPQGQMMPIGHEKINDYWFANSDLSKRNVVMAIASNKPFVYFAYHSTAGTSTYDKAIIYNWSNQRWVKASIPACGWVMAASVGLDLDTTGGETGDSLADSTAQSLDSYAYIGGRPFLGIVNSVGQLASVDGPPLAATLETTTAHVVPGQRAFVTDAEPLIDAVGCTVAVAVRERLQDAKVYGSPTVLEVTGKASILASGRLHTYRVITLANETWTNAQGVLLDAQPDGNA